MGLSSRWDRLTAVLSIFFAIGMMTGCLALSSGRSSTVTSGSVSAAAATLDFGTAVIGASKQLTDTLTNTSSTTVTIASAISSDPSFQVMAPAMPFNLAPGQSAALTVAFTPHAAGKPAGKLVISTSAATAGTLAVALAGNAVGTGALEVSPTSLAFGTVAVGQSMAKTATLKNSGGTSVTVSKASVDSTAFSISGLTLPATIAAGQSASLTVTFAPKTSGSDTASAAVSGSASLTTGSASGSSQDATISISASLALAGTAASAGQLTISPSSLSFGTVTVGNTQNQSVTVTNSGGTSATISQASATGAGIRVTGPTLPLVLASNQSATFQVTFAPTTAGATTGSFAVVSTAANSNLALAITGSAVSAGVLGVLPTSLGFGSVQVGSSQTQPVSITNSGGSSVTVTGATATGAGFSVSGLAFPVTLSPGQNAAFSVTFTPQASGTVTGNVAFASNVATATLPLSGTGLAPGSLSANPASVSFGSVQIGSNQPQTITLTNNASSSITISQASASGTGFSVAGLNLPATLASGQSASFTATFTPPSAGNATGSIVIASNASNPSLRIGLNGAGVTAGALSSNPTSIAFGSVQVGGTLSRSDTLTNTGGSLLHIATANITGAGFAIGGLTAPTTLNAGQSLTFTVTFTPQSNGAASGSLVLTADGAVTNLSVAFSGTGTAPGTLAVSPTSSNFGNVTVGASQNQSGTISASGAGVTVSAAASNNPEFTITGLSLPLTLNAGQSAPFTLTFRPQASGASSGTLTFSSNATNPSLTESLTGTGTAAPQHSVSLGWNPSTSTVVGYNVYRGTQSGGPYAVLNGSPDASTSYTDTSVQAGQTYFYVVTAVDSAGVESVFSNQAQAVVPTP